MSALPHTSPQSTGYHETPSMILPSTMPAELSTAIDAGGRRARALAASGRELHFDVDASGDLVVQLRDLDGNLLKTLSPTQAVSLMGGLGAV